MFSVRRAVEGNNKNSLKWWLIHYSLSSSMASPLFPLFSVFVYRGTSESMRSLTVNIECALQSTVLGFAFVILSYSRVFLFEKSFFYLKRI